MIKGAVASVYNHGHTKEHYYIQHILMSTLKKWLFWDHMEQSHGLYHIVILVNALVTTGRIVTQFL